MATMTEIERKFAVPDDFAMPDFTAIDGVASVDEPVELRLDATYYDTADLALARHRTTLRRRRGGHDAGWHLKRPARADRTELRLPAGDRERKVPDAIMSEIWVHSRGAVLEPIARIRTRRIERTVRAADGTALAVIASDAVQSESYEHGLATRTRQRWHELEAELVDGDRPLLAAIADALCAAGATPATDPSKIARALGSRYPAPSSAAPSSAAAAPASAAPTAAGDGATPRPGNGADAIAGYLRAQRDAIVGNDPLVRTRDPDGVHDMRVAIRRVRATLRTFRPVLDRDRTERLRAELHWFAGLLGAVRDSDVLRVRLDDAIAATPPENMVGPIADRIHERLAAERRDADGALTAAMTSRRYAEILDALDALVDGGAPRASDVRLRRAAGRALTRADAMLDTAGTLPERPEGIAYPSIEPHDRDAALHEARKAYKRARYAAEALAPIAGRPARRLAKRITALQDLLGAHQDAVVAARILRDYGMRAHLDGDNAYSYGVLQAQQAEAGRRSLEGLDRARRGAGKRSVRAWLA